MDSNLLFNQFWQVKSCKNITHEYLSALQNLVYQSDQQNLYNKPMPGIGIYIACASLLCILGMMADLLHGLRNKKLWFPCKYFTLNAASLTVIAVAIKLPMDLSNLMPGDIDLAAKFGSQCFMCIMLANLLPSLATMDSKQLVANIIALGILVITMVVNIFIQINTGILLYAAYDTYPRPPGLNVLYGAMSVCSLMLLIIYVCSALAILKSKEILESKYQAAHKIALKDHELDQPGKLLTVEKLKQHVKHYWIMAETGSPQFMTACTATTSASWVICAFGCGLLILIMLVNLEVPGDYKSDYKWLKAMLSPSSNVLGQDTAQLGKYKELRHYVLQLQDDIEFPDRTLKGISKSVNHLIRKAEKQQPRNLMKLLAKSRGFEGVENFDSSGVESVVLEEYLNCWSLPLVTLTSIAMSLPNIQKKTVDSLVSGVSEGLVYVKLVEKNLNAIDDHVIIQKAAQTLWLEVEVYHKWLGNKLPNPKPRMNTPGHILQWLRDTAKDKVDKVENMDIRGRNDHAKYKSICANSMYRITGTMLSYHENDDEFSQDELFAQLSSMIADILTACLTNLPQVIATKCHTSAIEKREASVQAAAQLLGETTQIINSLQDRELPSLNQDELAFIDKWRAYLKNPYP
ncbi:hypothetical protein L2E82_51294 [Cichorium intybus]|nr:hypothetical protein L2E82_51294 [Cichorium intybus]